MDNKSIILKVGVLNCNSVFVSNPDKKRELDHNVRNISYDIKTCNDKVTK